MVPGIVCDPELRLSLGTAIAEVSADGRSIDRSMSAGLARVESLLKNTAKEKHPMTIFYKGRVCVCHATEFQARAIISMAKRELNEMNTMAKKKQEEEETSPAQESMESTLSSSPPPREVSEILNSGLSMKRSLQRFLQKRKARIHNSAPYTQKPKLFLFPIELKQA